MHLSPGACDDRQGTISSPVQCKIVPQNTNVVDTCVVGARVPRCRDAGVVEEVEIRPKSGGV